MKLNEVLSKVPQNGTYTCPTLQSLQGRIFFKNEVPQLLLYKNPPTTIVEFVNSMLSETWTEL